jgi:glycosyltransferase involved in cell wall biosynthesis
MKRWVVAGLSLCFGGASLSVLLFGWDAYILHRFARPEKEEFFAVMEHKPFVIIVPSYNNSEWVERNLNSIFTQKYDNYRVIYIDDASQDSTLRKVKDSIDNHQMAHRTAVIHNEKNLGACENINRAVHSCCDEEIAMVLDGDDWFAHDRVLQRLNEIYASPDVWMTYGSYIEHPTYSYTVANFAQPLPKKVVEKNKVREYTRKHWCLSHLRTFYVSLFKKIKTEDLLLDGKYYDATYDFAFMLPMAEMAGSHAKYVGEIFYIYNRETPLNDSKVRARRQQQIAEHILELPPYGRLYAKD